MENNRICQICGSGFYRRGKRKAVTCSLVCKAKHVSLSQTGKEKTKKGTYFKCKTCKQVAYCNPSQTNRVKYCSMKCRNGDKTFWMRISGPKHYAWKGGKTLTVGGYVYIRKPNHPSATSHKYVLEHRLVMEKQLGRYLMRHEEVHHKNGIKNDNRVSNLELVNRNMHFGKVQCPHCLKEFTVK